MNHINLDLHVEAVQRLLLSIATEPNGTILELNGHTVACLVPVAQTNGMGTTEWSDALNERRWELLNKKHDAEPLTPSEIVELAQLQEAMLKYRQKVAPLPLRAAQQLYDELLQQAATTPPTV